MFIESREPPGDAPGSGREPWLLTAVGWLLPWPALIVWLIVASRFADGWIGVAFAFGAVGITAWRAARAFPTDGLDQVRQ